MEHKIHTEYAQQHNHVFNITIVDDDIRIQDLLRKYLSQAGFSVYLASHKAGLMRLLAKKSIDLIVLDVMLPFENGFTICENLRKSNINIPVILLTARGDDESKIKGLEIGADDYLSKPFNPRELLARINIILKRSKQINPNLISTNYTNLISVGNLILDLQNRTLIDDNNKITQLTTGEFSILKILIENANIPLSRNKLSFLVKRRSISFSNRSLDVRISRLRKLIEPDVTMPRYIQTVWGEGYVFVPHHKKDPSIVSNMDQSIN